MANLWLLSRRLVGAIQVSIGVRAGGGGGGGQGGLQPPPKKKLGVTQVFWARREIWAKPVFKDVFKFLFCFFFLNT